MVKGISRQVIVVRDPDRKLFEQAIFILRDDALEGQGISDQMLIREAKRLIDESPSGRPRKLSAYGAVWACAGAVLASAVWCLISFF